MPRFDVKVLLTTLNETPAVTLAETKIARVTLDPTMTRTAALAKLGEALDDVAARSGLTFTLEA